MTDPSPFEILAGELGAVAGRVEREAGLRLTAALSDLATREAERELRIARMELAVTERLAALQSGQDGQNGRDGVDGRDGAEGPQGPPGAKGEPGERGELGPAGARGADGAPGAQGEAGPQGLAGIQGSVGDRGEAGPPGERGADGAPGAVGERGPEGAPGKLSVVRVWVEGVHYEGDVVTKDGATFQATRDTGREPPHEDWLCLAGKGADGKGLTIRGTFNDGEVYRQLDVVARNGGSFVAVRDDPGPCPGDGWQLWASPGKRGERGERGERGLVGAKGLDGASITGGTFDAKEMKLVLTRSDGGTVAVDMYDFALALKEA